jgi:hypothetical protein
MNRSKMWLALLAAGWLSLAAEAAPAPAPVAVPTSPIAEALRLRGLLPGIAPLAVSPAVMAGEDTIQMERRLPAYQTVTRNVTQMIPAQKVVTETVKKPGGGAVQVQRVVTEMVPVTRQVQVSVQVPGGRAVQVRVAVKACKFFVVSKEGKLKALDADKATALLKKRTAVLAGTSAEVDPRTLDLIKPGTLCVIHEPPAPERLPEPRPPVPDRRGP